MVNMLRALEVVCGRHLTPNAVRMLSMDMVGVVIYSVVNTRVKGGSGRREACC